MDLFRLLFLIQTGPGNPDVPPSTDAANLFNIAAQMMDTILSSVIVAIQSSFGYFDLMKLLVVIAGGILIIHGLEGLLKGVRGGGASGMAWNIVGAIWDKVPRFLIFVILASTVMVTSFGVSSLRGTNLWNNNWDVAEVGSVWTQLLGSGVPYKVTKNGTEYWTVSSPPMLSNFQAAIKQASGLIDGLDYMRISGVAQSEINAALEKASRDNSVAVQTAHATISGSFIGWIGTALDQIIDLMIGLEFAAAQYSLAKALLLQMLFVKLSWFVTLQFLPLFIMLAYFRPLQTFLTSALFQLVVMSVAMVVIGALALALFKPDTWLNPQTGIIHMAFSQVNFSTTGAFDPGTWPWFTARYAKQIAIAQIIMLLFFLGTILSQVYGILVGVIGGHYSTLYSTAESGPRAVFGGQ